MVVHDFGLRWAFRRPNKAHPELVVDPDRVLSLAVARQRLETVAWRRPQVPEIVSGIEVAQFPARNFDQVGWKALGSLAAEDCLGGLASEAPDHRSKFVPLNDTAVKVRVSSDDTGSKPAAVR